MTLKRERNLSPKLKQFKWSVAKYLHEKKPKLWPCCCLPRLQWMGVHPSMFVKRTWVVIEVLQTFHNWASISLFHEIWEGQDLPKQPGLFNQTAVWASLLHTLWRRTLANLKVPCSLPFCMRQKKLCSSGYQLQYLEKLWFLFKIRDTCSSSCQIWSI